MWNFEGCYCPSVNQVYNNRDLFDRFSCYMYSPKSCESVDTKVVRDCELSCAQEEVTELIASIGKLSIDKVFQRVVRVSQHMQNADFYTSKIKSLEPSVHGEYFNIRSALSGF